ncbi:hypothetical protein CYLTODRAFT_361549 [Cylindrobasidium torrendii FP15055 ss-10]|uniref:Uncharacterized protein n=1 Tax=Cylindrobasidium torrendii FP15055 ss-10 TaxID=1314674 RepID=A0A0D7AWM5_9AGAR|nr:hypothetical protein CYLTODRAFT_361549 [Cylindrobasidium torrendii FP15055 ss-10]
MLGVPAFDIHERRRFSLRAYLLYIFGDMPAISKLMKMKGVNGYSPCRMCNIHGVADPSNPRTLYTPLYRPDGTSYDPHNLPLRSHSEFTHQSHRIATAPSQAEADRRAREYGITGTSVLSTLSSISFPLSAPFDFMHLIENVMPTLTAHWTGTFKGMTRGDEDYIIPANVWQDIGQDLKSSGDTMPSAFGSRMPDIATERYQFKAENWFTFLMFLGPVVLHGRLKSAYYRHFLKLVNIFHKLLAYYLSYEDIGILEVAIIDWVADYERYVLDFEARIWKVDPRAGSIFDTILLGCLPALSRFIRFSTYPTTCGRLGRFGATGTFPPSAFVGQLYVQFKVANILSQAWLTACGMSLN